MTMIAYADSAIPSPISGIPAVFDAMCSFAAYFVWIVIVITVIMVVVSAFYFLTSAGETDKVEKARRTLTYAAIGVVVVLFAVAFPVIVGDAVGYQSSPGEGLSPMCAILGGTGGSGSVTTQ